MEEIILCADRKESSSLLPLLLRVLFPECRVTVLWENETAENRDEWKGED